MDRGAKSSLRSNHPSVDTGASRETAGVMAGRRREQQVSNHLAVLVWNHFKGPAGGYSEDDPVEHHADGDALIGSS